VHLLVDAPNWVALARQETAVCWGQRGAGRDAGGGAGGPAARAAASAWAQGHWAPELHPRAS